MLLHVSTNRVQIFFNNYISLHEISLSSTQFCMGIIGLTNLFCVNAEDKLHIPCSIARSRAYEGHGNAISSVDLGFFV